MQPHLCPAMGLILVQPHITRPLPPASSDLGVCPDQTPTLLSTRLTLLSTQLTHLLQPFRDTSPTDSAHPHHSTTTTFTKQLQVLKQTGFLAICPLQPFQLICTPTWCPVVLALRGPFSPLLSVHTDPSVPEPGSTAPGHRRKVEDGTCHSHLLLQGAPVPSVFPQPSVGVLDHL